MCYQSCYEKDKMWRYNVRRKATVWMPFSAILLMLLLMAVGVVIMFELIDEHLKQTVKMSTLKALQIKAQTIQELQQNDLMLVNSAL